MKQYEVFGFSLPFDGEMIYCETVMHDWYYNILFNGNLIGRIAINNDGIFKQVTGVRLPVSTIEKISNNIEAHYA